MKTWYWQKWVTKSKHRHLVANIEKGTLFEKKAFLFFLEITYQRKKGMLFVFLIEIKKGKKTNLLHFSVSTSKHLLILELPEPSSDHPPPPPVYVALK